MPLKVHKAIVFVLFCLFPLSTMAWGWEAHKLICAMAERQLTPAAADMVERILDEGAELKDGGRNFAESCLWADEVKYTSYKGTYEHHFVNVPQDALTVELARDCAAISCTPVGIQQALTYLATEPDGDRALVRRSAALRYLGHYVGDLHQPLHVGNAVDWGGNKIVVKWQGEETNLHALWDYKMPEQMGLKHPQSVSFLLTVKPARDNRLDILSWFNESLTAARAYAYVDANGQLIQSGDQISKAYFERAKPVILMRMAMAASRLANLLNRIADGEDIRAFKLTD